jgi:hypothetical protein
MTGLDLDNKLVSGPGMAGPLNHYPDLNFF